MSLANLRDFAIVVVLFMIQPSPAFQKRNIVSDVCYYSTYSLLNKEEFEKIAIRKHCILQIPFTDLSKELIYTRKGTPFGVPSLSVILFRS